MNDQIKPRESFQKVVDRFVDQLTFLQNPAEGIPPFPQHIHIEPTNACNLRCIHCVQDAMQRKRGMMDMDIYRKVIDEIGPLGCAISLNVQGEPMLHPHILDMVAYAKSAGCHVSLLTNATRLTAAKSARLIELGLDRVVFSFDAVDQDLYERIRKRAKFKPTLANILEFLRQNLEAGSPTFVCASIIHEEATSGHLEEYKRYFSELPVNTIFVSELLNMSGYSSISSEIDLTKHENLKNEDRPICRVPWENITVNWDGRVCSCPLDFEITCPVGDVRTHSLKDIWQSPAFQEFREAHLERNYACFEKGQTLCSTCNCLWDPEYDLRGYPEFVKKAVLRQAGHYANALTERKSDIGLGEKRISLMKRINEL
ncbi:radical SAM additional 4Fe4S-binding SPASM domain-containing protein [Desulfonatronum thiosulfatophilum]|uniref:Radical SAM additional 4Fe4S-binding SPASM domain-containing protein n=1 Tax=Desulfonatronum thiosulfatophilum TaxID=617002 RepID=A0A1G6DUR7_9BACT|nr:radical SAM protein [Desulfonatronum thiosulfatophilum]SDB48937.1 radical SAM additional 4Fe4S-binding SPASM domain-containing protein [Desulfonatronum thiosulfatophilum]